MSIVNPTGIHFLREPSPQNHFPLNQSNDVFLADSNMFLLKPGVRLKLKLPEWKEISDMNARPMVRCELKRIEAQLNYEFGPIYSHLKNRFKSVAPGVIYEVMRGNGYSGSWLAIA